MYGCSNRGNLLDKKTNFPGRKQVGKSLEALVIQMAPFLCSVAQGGLDSWHFFFFSVPPPCWGYRMCHQSQSKHSSLRKRHCSWVR